MPARNVLQQKHAALYNTERACNVLESLTIRSPVTEPQNRDAAQAELDAALSSLASAKAALTELETIAEDLKKKWSA